MQATCGIGAGSTFAVFEIGGYLDQALRSIQSASPSTAVAIHVDDLRLYEQQPNQAKVVQHLAVATSLAIEEFGRLDLEFSVSKTTIASTSRWMGVHLAKKLGLPAGVVCRTMRELGLDVQLGKGPLSRPVRKKRHRLLK